jgi:transposase
MQVTTIGLDIAKNVFQVHAIDKAEKVVVRKQLRRSQVVEFFEAMPCGRIWPSSALWLQLVRTEGFRTATPRHGSISHSRRYLPA